MASGFTPTPTREDASSHPDPSSPALTQLLLQSPAGGGQELSVLRGRLHFPAAVYASYLLTRAQSSNMASDKPKFMDRGVAMVQLQPSERPPSGALTSELGCPRGVHRVGGQGPAWEGPCASLWCVDSVWWWWKILQSLLWGGTEVAPQ